MKKIIIGILFCLPVFVIGQNKGIQWSKGLTFEQIKQKAKTEKKYILLDCFATWCGPCKEMDAKVYPVDSVGDFINQNFIPVRVQFDKTKADDAETTSWYHEIPSIGANYIIEGYPTFIYLSPDGNLAYKFSGGVDAGSFLKKSRWAMNPDNKYQDPLKLYASLSTKFKKGIVVEDSLAYLLIYQQKSSLFEADSIYRDEWKKLYQKYLTSLSPAERYTPDNIFYWSSINMRLTNPLLQYFIKDGAIIDSVLNYPGYSSGFINNCVGHAIVQPFFIEQNKNKNVRITGMQAYRVDMLGHMVAGTTDTTEADWNELKKRISEYFDEKNASRYVRMAKLDWYGRHVNNDGNLKVLLEMLENNPEDIPMLAVNNQAFEAFRELKDVKMLDLWSKVCGVLANRYSRVDWLWDTYASLLYKMGRVDDAIKSEENAAILKGNNEYRQIVEQMKSRRPIYLDQGVNWEGIDHVNWQGFSYSKSFSVVAEDGKTRLEDASIYNIRSKQLIRTNIKGFASIDVMLGDKISIGKEGNSTETLVIAKSTQNIVRVVLKSSRPV